MEDQKKAAEPAATVTINGRGPIRIEGCFELVDSSGAKLPVTDNLVKICGCGRSQHMPLCDGTHKK
ncbi:CDGSH iron-sulfur domain-containing protein [uncultured Acetobacteroides sp.]|uniref:CDGSH iron-sulfur domain-containing protein n=1 Tax=uncultured Acetobacteroides sp. TaxID=1760811 RepID=UPI0029F4D2B1|nr:CDGSH iron-sulfur domain-containing protein [uncultured Acetobacteroides sp.]